MRIRTLLAMLTAAAVAWAARGTDEVQYMALFIQDAKVGQARSERSVTDCTIRNETLMDLSISRGRAVIPARATERFTETAGGEAVAFDATVTMSGAVVLGGSGVIRDGKIHLTSKTVLGRRTRRSLIPAAPSCPRRPCDGRRPRASSPGPATASSPSSRRAPQAC